MSFVNLKYDLCADGSIWIVFDISFHCRITVFHVVYRETAETIE